MGDGNLISPAVASGSAGDSKQLQPESTRVAPDRVESAITSLIERYAMYSGYSFIDKGFMAII